MARLVAAEPPALLLRQAVHCVAAAILLSVGLAMLGHGGGGTSVFPMVLLCFGVAGIISLRAVIEATNAQRLRQVSSMLRVEGDDLLFPRPVRVTPGKISIRLRVVHSGKRTYTRTEASFKPAGETVIRDKLSPSDFLKARISGLIRARALAPAFSAGIGGLRIGMAGSDVLEWLELPAYRIDDFSGRHGSIVVALLSPVHYHVKLEKSILYVQRGSDEARVLLEADDGSLRGTLEYYPAGSSRAARLELVVKLAGRTMRSILAEATFQGHQEFSYTPPSPSEHVYILVSTATPAPPSEIMNRIGLYGEIPILGEAWRNAETLVRLALDVPLARNPYDEATVHIEPI